MKGRDEVFSVESVKAYLNQDFILFLVSECGCAFNANHFEFLKCIHFEMCTLRPASLIT